MVRACGSLVRLADLRHDKVWAAICGLAWLGWTWPVAGFVRTTAGCGLTTAAQPRRCEELITHS
jgi:hypothetical protein